MTDPAPDAAEIAALVARHAPQARRFLAWQAGPALAGLLAAARRATPDWVMGIEAAAGALAPLLETLPPDPCLHLRAGAPFEPPPPGLGHPLLGPAHQGLRADVVLVGGRDPGFSARAARFALAPGGIVLLPRAAAAQPALAPVLEVLEQGATLAALRPRRAAPPPPPRPPGRRAIIVTVVGDQTEAEWAITGPSVAAYAASVGAELVVCRDGRGLPGPALKSAAREAAAAHERVILMDADILVRPHAPDLFAIVPPERVGAYPAGRHFPRAAIAAEAAALHGARPFPVEDYVNAGLMVLSRAHLGLLDALAEGFVGGRIPEQDTVNVALHRAGFGLHRLPAEFNLIATGRHPADWRCGWMLHTAGAPKAAYRSRIAWARQAIPRGAVWTARPLTGRALRLPHMVAQAARIAGRAVRLLDPDGIDHATPRAMLRLMPDGVAASWIAAGEGEEPVATGRIEGLSAGRWRLAPLPLPGAAPPDCRMQARLPGGTAALPATAAEGALLLDLPEGVAAIEVALLPGPAEVALAGLLLTRLD